MQRPGWKHAEVGLECLGGSKGGWVLVKYSVRNRGAPSKAGASNGSPSWNALDTMLRVFKGVSSSTLVSQYWIKDKNGQRCCH